MTDGQVEAILSEIGLSVESEDDTHYMIFCPYHSNRHSPACSVAKNTGYFFCFGAGCGKQGTITDLVKHVAKVGTFPALRIIEKHESGTQSVTEFLTELYADKDEMPEFPADALAKMQQYFWDTEDAQRYIASRGINRRTAEHFQLAFDPGQRMVAVPMFDTTGRAVGIIGRSIEGKIFKNSKNLPTKKTLFNIHNAKKAGVDTVILVESSFDALRVHQAGYPNVCATLGGTFSDYHVTQVSRHFNKLILMTDNDEPGIKFSKKIAAKTEQYGTSVYRGRYDEFEIYPDGAKDCCDMTDDQIAWCIRNASVML